jgi:hypothetical protein
MQMSWKVSKFICYSGSISLSDCYNLSLYILERDIDGAEFCSLSREDIAMIFPSKQKFLLGVKLYREIQKIRQQTIASASDFSDTESFFTSTQKTPSPTATETLTQQPSKRTRSGSDVSQAKRKDVTLGTFSLPEFSPDINLAIRHDGFHTSTIRNKLIREACRALKGHCRKQGKAITAAEKRMLGKMLYRIAPKSLGDPEGLAVVGVPEVCPDIYYY